MDRRKAIHRRRRIIFNDDAGSLHRETSTTPEAFLADRLDHVVGTQVDSVWWSFMTGAEGYLYDTQVGEVAGREPYPGAPKADREGMAIKWRNIKSFFDAGTDPLRVVIEFCRQHGLEMFASFRMNMCQDSWRPNFTTKWKREHPELCLGVRGMYEFCDPDDPWHLFWSSLDYEQPAVRAQRLAVIEEICSGYDVDGMELDFWRWPAFFKPTLDGLPVLPRHLAIMTDFMRAVRESMRRIEAEKDHPLLLAPRVFETPEINRRLGLDVETWLEEGLIDLLVVGGTYHEHALPVAEWAELAHRHNVPLYPCKYRSTSVEQDRAMAANFFSQGADGIYTFNLRLPKDRPLIEEIGEPERIATEDKLYVMPTELTDAVWGPVCAPGLLPVRLAEGEPRCAPLIIGDDVPQAALDDRLAELSLTLSLRHFVPDEDEVAFKVNGRPLKKPRRTEPEGEVCHLRFPLYTVYTDLRREPPVIQGKNTIEATLRRRSPAAHQPVDLVGVELTVRYQ